MLVVADALDPGWRATVDGAPADIVPVWGVVRGVRVTAGAHVVEMRYRPPGLLAGAGLSLAALLLAGLALAFTGGRATPASTGRGTL